MKNYNFESFNKLIFINYLEFKGNQISAKKEEILHIIVSEISYLSFMYYSIIMVSTNILDHNNNRESFLNLSKGKLIIKNCEFLDLCHENKRFSNLITF